jgi:NADH dehydrogenase
MARRDIVVFGGSGFIGRYLVRALADDGWRVIVAVRDPEAARFLQPLGSVGQIVPIACDIGDSGQVAAVVARADAVVNLVGLLHERGRQTFRRIHVEAARHIGEAAAASGIRRIVQVSAIGASPRSPSNYARSKAAAEETLRGLVPETVIVRPSIVFGPEDRFFNMFARLAVFSPVLPLFGGGTTRFQPVYVEDVARAIVAALDDEDARGRTFELGGPRIYSFRQLMEVVRQQTGRRVCLLPLPFAVASLQAAFLQFLPDPPLTPDQVRLLKVDNVVAPGALGFADLGVVPTTVEVIVPTYLARYRPSNPREAVG